MFKKLLLLVVFVFGSSALASVKLDLKVEKYKLKNGLTVLLHQDLTVPVVSFHQWYRVGSRNEKKGRTGLAHFFEHLMFKGTTKYSGADFERLVKLNGGSNNAFTSFDYTGYYVNLPSGQIEKILDMESDRMQNLLFDPKTIKSEREVVKEERRYRVENSVQGYMREALFSTLFKVHPYTWPVIGSMVDLNAATIADLKEFYKIYYAPNNSVLVLAGNFNIPNVKKLIKKYYGGIPAQKLPEVNLPQEPDQLAVRTKKLKKDVQNPSFYVAYKTAAAGTADSYVLDIMSSILGGGETSRLYQRLVYKGQIATQTFSYSYTPKDPGVFAVFASVKSKKYLKRNKQIVMEEINKLKKKKVTDKELERAKNQFMKSYVDTLQTVSSKAQTLALNEILFGDYTEFLKDLSKYNKVTKEDIIRVANKYFKKQRSVYVEVTKK